mmetsp:Transcript_56119/g.93531  ORF Transcript_56119/g.93531 Transcript_56119/m.93531 type:complete len:105 (-) Transcript_56119:124-438(-)|eukprot:CAMPEP_0202704850 /NCGR_PEP_ID=MMETSP1385-20130828/17476_1 /ASSEMBLY_ACC=CAM_ASM_000861 /TAXON_ID=933848 /ORGANISM="Elphidium margaritaceum" /LENGTH=104 /DNA_ID=CAMNT_0049362963 /DNA_START=36 /DNA_END=350 /DNA_ORIENTATION=-
MAEEEEVKTQADIAPSKTLNLKALFAAPDPSKLKKQALAQEEEKRSKLQAEYDRISKAIKAEEAADALLEFMSQTASIKKDALFTIFDGDHPFQINSKKDCLIM